MNVLLLSGTPQQGITLNSTILSPKYDNYLIEARQEQLQNLLNTATVPDLLQTVSAKDCLSQFKRQFSTKYSTALLVSNSSGTSSTAGTILNGWLEVINATTQAYPGFVCQIPGQSWAESRNGEWLFPFGCNYSSVLHDHSPVSWQIPILRAGEPIQNNYYLTGNGQVVPAGSATVDNCLLGSAEEHCSLSLSRVLITIVIVCNIIKLTCYIIGLRFQEFDPLVTVGDAIASFLTVEDENTCNMSWLSFLDFKRKRFPVQKVTDTQESPFFPANRNVNSRIRHLRLFKVVGRARWAFMIGL